MKKVKGIVFAAVSAATFGLIPLYANQAIIDGVNNETILVYRYGIAGLLYAIYLWISKVSMRLSLAELREVLIAGVGGYGITAFFLFLSYHYMPTGMATAIHFFYPVVVAVLMAVFYREKLSVVVKVGLFFVLMSTLTYGSYIVALNRPVLKRINPDVLTCYVMLFSAAFYFLVAVVQGKLEIVARPAFVLDMFLLALLSTILSARLLVAAVKLIGPVPSSVLGTLEPLTAITVGVFYFHEQLTFLNYVGLIVVIVAVTIVICKMKK